MATDLAALKANLNTVLDDNTTTFYSDAERLTALNNSYKYMFNLAVSEDGATGLCAAMAWVSVTADSETLGDMPSSWYKIIEISYISDNKSDSYEAIGPFTAHRARQLVSRGSKVLCYYTLGNSVYLAPTPNYSITQAEQKIRIIYIPNPTDMADDADEPSLIPETHRELLVYLAAKRLLNKEKADLGADANEVYSRLLQAFERDIGGRVEQSSRTVFDGTPYVGV